MKISIITPSYNQASFIERTIISVLEQNYPEFEHIIIDGGSTDNTLNILKKYKHLKWVSEKDKGQSEAINKGFRKATGDIIAFLNSDDTYSKGSFFMVNEYFINNPDKKWACGKCRIININDVEIRRYITLYKNLLLKRYTYKNLLKENFISQPAVFWKRELIEEIGYLNENEHFCMDYEYWLRIGQKYDAGIICYYLSNFRYYPSSKSGSVNKNQFLDELRIAHLYGKKYPFSLFLHKLNYYKIIIIYNILNFSVNKCKRLNKGNFIKLSH